MGADAESILFTNDFLKLMTQQCSFKAQLERCKGEVWEISLLILMEKNRLLAEGGLEGVQLFCALEGNSKKGYKSIFHPGQEK